MASSAWPLAQPEPHRRRRCRTGGQNWAARIASRPTSAPCMCKGATSRAKWAVCPARACACARVCLSRRRACKENRALAHSRTRALKKRTQTTTCPESPPRRAARAVVPVPWVFSCGARTHTTRRRAPHQRRRCRMGGANGQLAMRADLMAPCRSKEGKRKSRSVFEPGVCIARTCPPYGARCCVCAPKSTEPQGGAHWAAPIMRADPPAPPLSEGAKNRAKWASSPACACACARLASMAACMRTCTYQAQMAMGWCHWATRIASRPIGPSQVRGSQGPWVGLIWFNKNTFPGLGEFRA